MEITQRFTNAIQLILVEECVNGINKCRSVARTRNHVTEAIVRSICLAKKNYNLRFVITGRRI